MLAASHSVISGSDTFAFNVLSIPWLVGSVRDGSRLLSTCLYCSRLAPACATNTLPYNDPDARWLRRAIPFRKRLVIRRGRAWPASLDYGLDFGLAFRSPGPAPTDPSSSRPSAMLRAEAGGQTRWLRLAHSRRSGRLSTREPSPRVARRPARPCRPRLRPGQQVSLSV